jgi:hypothetical protein
MIRNVIQSVQDREIVKTSPDIVVFLDGLPYLLNPYLNDADNNIGTIVSFNDHVTAFTAGYDTESLVPNCTLTLQIPNHEKFLYQVPGGNNTITTMMQIQVFAKGYYLSTKGNSLYHRVFKGLISHIDYTDDGKMLQISLQCLGLLHFLEIMQIELQPAAMSNSSYEVTPFYSNQANMNPYQALAFTFSEPILVSGTGVKADTFGGFLLTSLSQGKVGEGPYAQALEAGYIVKWQAILNEINKEVHVFGGTWKDNLKTLQDLVTPGDSQDQEAPNKKAKKFDKVGSQNQQDQLTSLYLDAIRNYLPDMGIGSISLLGNHIVSRVQRIRELINRIGFEGYQDIDGRIIIKPPLYNLDVTQLGDNPQTASSEKSATQVPSVPSSQDIYNENNPFIIYLAEILTEQESEDEQGVRATRMVVQGAFDTKFMIENTQSFLSVGEYIDVAKLAQFGLREEAAKPLTWLQDDDKFGLFAFAANELARANRGYRTYNVTIPLRPELKLGFPIYFPHKDFYGYIKSIGITYNQGGEALMNIHLDTIRKRPMYPVLHTDPDTKEKSQIFTTQPNLVLKWTKVSSTQNTSSTDPNGDPLDEVFHDTGDGSDSNSPANLEGRPATIPLSSNLFPDQMKVINYRRNTLGNTWTVEADTTSNMFRIQPDTEQVFTKPRKVENSPDDSLNSVFQDTGDGSSSGRSYYKDVRTTIPYTDDGGYELVSPFPWGRWRTLKQAIQDFTRSGVIVENPAVSENTTLSGASAFLFAGSGTPVGSIDKSEQLKSALLDLAETAENNTIFELAYDPNNISAFGDGLLPAQQPSDANDVKAVNNIAMNEQTKVQTFLNPGSNTSSKLAKSIRSLESDQETVLVVPPND